MGLPIPVIVSGVFKGVTADNSSQRFSPNTCLVCRTPVSVVATASAAAATTITIAVVTVTITWAAAITVRAVTKA